MQNLEEFLNMHIEKGLVPNTEICALLGQRILKIIDLAQNKYDIAYKDISSNNSIIHRVSGALKQIDWGSASEEYNKNVVLKPPYASPELVKSWCSDAGFDVDSMSMSLKKYFKSDIFSFSILMYELITGINPVQIPKEFETNIKLAMNYRLRDTPSDNIIPLNSFCQDVPDELSDLVKSGFNENPSKRPNAKNLKSLFSRYLYSGQISGAGIEDNHIAFYLSALENYGTTDIKELLDEEGKKLSRCRHRVNAAKKLGSNVAFTDVEIYETEDIYQDLFRDFSTAYGVKKVDECRRFYIKEQYDIQKEIETYLEYNPDVFRGKVVYCNCDDPFESNFFRYFVLNFNKLGLKQLITASYKPSPVANTQLELYGNDKTLTKAKGRPKINANKFIINEVHDIDGDGEFNLKDVAKQLKVNKNNEWTPLEKDGDFRSPECIELLKQRSEERRVGKECRSRWSPYH